MVRPAAFAVPPQRLRLYRDYLYETLWGDDMSLDTRTLDTHITRLRRKLHLGDRLRTVRNVGYMLEKE